MVLTVPNLYERDARIAPKEIPTEKQAVLQKDVDIHSAVDEDPTTKEHSSSLFPHPTAERPEVSATQRRNGKLMYDIFFTNRPRKGL